MGQTARATVRTASTSRTSTGKSAKSKTKGAPPSSPRPAKAGKAAAKPAPKAAPKPAAKPAPKAAAKPAAKPAPKPEPSKGTAKKPAASTKTKVAAPAPVVSTAPQPVTRAPKLTPVAGGRASTLPPPPPPAPAKASAPPPAPGQSNMAPRAHVRFVTIPPPPPLPRQELKLTVGDKAVHPSHGLGEVTGIETRDIGGKACEFYVLRILDNGMRVMVPTAGTSGGLRAVMSAKEADSVLETMRAREVAVDLQPWSRRFRAYTEMIKSGSPYEVAKVLRDMYRLRFDKDLSFGERRLLDQAKSLLMKELALAKKMTETTLQAEVDEMFRS